MSLTADMKTLIPSGAAASAAVFRGDMPDTPDNLVCLFQTGGGDPSHSFSAREFEEPSFQVMIRNKSFDTAISKAEAVKDALDGQTDLTINGNTYLSIFLQGDILPLGKDAKNRQAVSINFRAKVKRS